MEDLKSFRLQLYDTLLKEFLSYLKGDNPRFMDSSDDPHIKEAKVALISFTEAIDEYVVSFAGSSGSKQPEQSVGPLSVHEPEEKVQKSEEKVQKSEESFYYSCIQSKNEAVRSQKKEEIDRSVREEIKSVEPSVLAGLYPEIKEKSRLSESVQVKSSLLPQDTQKVQPSSLLFPLFNFSQRPMSGPQEQFDVYKRICQLIGTFVVETKRDNRASNDKILQLIKLCEDTFKTVTKGVIFGDPDKENIGRKVITILNESNVGFVKELQVMDSKEELEDVCEELLRAIYST